MVERHGKDRIGYWFQLVVSMGIATYGLVLGSAGVVIGAMLVSPLMGPLVEIGMGLAVGSPLLVLHSTLRTAASLVVVIGLSALLTVLLPYHEATGEILSRTSPTLLDLYVASFCALAAAYTTVKQGSDTVTAAAGTAISIALVPPLCVVGWGIGSGRFVLARGAALLFTSNLCAILLFTVVVFLLLAYDAVDVETVEASADSESRTLDRVALRLRSFFGSKYGPALRLLMPIALVTAVFVPLRRALYEVAWTTKVRGDVQHVIDALPPAKHAVRSSVVVERHAVSVRLVIVGDASAARDLKSELDTRITALAGIIPSVNVIAVPDVEAVRLAAEGTTTAPTIPTVPKPDVELIEHELDSELRHRWPSGATGPLTTWRLVITVDGDSMVEVVHFGAPLGEAAEKMLGVALSERIAHPLVLRDFALSALPVEASAERGLEWLPSLVKAVDQSVMAGVGSVCITSAAPEAKGRGKDIAEIVDAQIAEQARRLPPSRVFLTRGKVWSVKLLLAGCPEAAVEGAADAGSD